MDSKQFDRVARTLAQAGTRRGVVRLLAVLPVAGALGTLRGDDTAAGGRHKRRTTRNKRQSGNDKDNRNGKRKGQTKRACAKTGQTPKKGNRKGCCQGLTKDGTGRCAASVAPAPAVCTGLTPTTTSPTQGLQEAIKQAERDGITTLTLCPGTWHLSATVVIQKNITLRGAGAGQSILDGGRPPSGPGGVRVLQIEPGATVTVADLTITKGSIVRDNGAGIYNGGTLTLTDVSVTGNASPFGAGIFNDFNATLTLMGGTVTGNSATARGGGIFHTGATMTLTDVTVTGNSASVGAGMDVASTSGSTVLTNVTVMGNSAGGTGGGIVNESRALTLNTSRVIDNDALNPDGGGAGIVNYAGKVTLNDSEVTANTGGGIVNRFGGTVTVDAETLVCDNTPLDSQCSGDATSTYIGPCPNPATGICRP